MAASAGQQLVAGRMPGERIATAIETSDSAGVTSETVVMTVEAPVVSGRIYRVKFTGSMQSTVSGDQITQRVREDNLAGNQLQGQRAHIESGGDAGGTFGYDSSMEVEYTAATTENKTFVVTIDRQSGTGNVRLEASSSRPAYLYVDYIRDA